MFSLQQKGIGKMSFLIFSNFAVLVHFNATKKHKR